ncbi:MAG: hypothetical protein ACREO8_07460, partial [Luteimonas sp.]
DVATAFGVQAFHVNRAAAVDDALCALLAHDGPALLHVAIDQAANVWPLVPPNHNNAQMLDADEVTTLPGTEDDAVHPEPTHADVAHALSA